MQTIPCSLAACLVSQTPKSSSFFKVFFWAREVGRKNKEAQVIVTFLCLGQCPQQLLQATMALAHTGEPCMIVSFICPLGSSTYLLPLAIQSWVVTLLELKIQGLLTIPGMAASIFYHLCSQSPGEDSHCSNTQSGFSSSIGTQRE